MGSSESFVKFDKVDKSYDGEILVVKDLNVDIPQGEFLTMLGPSGSGKTTTLMMLAGFETPTSGEIYLEGEAINKIPPYKRGIGMVFQNYALFPHLTVYENLAFPLKVRKLAKDDIDKKVDKALSMVSLSGFETRMPTQLSGGQQQRVGIARSLAVDPEVWFLDEPFSALDPLIRGEMQNEFLKIQELLHKTIIFITHDFDEAIKLADRIAIMKDGKIIQIGSPEELVISPSNSYVKEFTKEIVRSKVLTAKSIMDQNSIDNNLEYKINENSIVDEFSSKIIDNNIKGLVVNSNGQGIGTIDKNKVIDILMNRE